MTRRAALTGALLVTIAAPVTWPLALAAFLLRGGLIVVARPILVLPNPGGLGNLLAPTLTSVVFGGVSTGFVILASAIVVAGLTVVVAGGLLAAILEAEAARIVASHEDAAPAAGPRAGFARPRRVEAGRILMARVIAHLPLAIVLAWGSVRLVAITYRELTNPFDVATPIVWRVLRAAPDVVAAVLLTWTLGQSLGAIAARRVVLAQGGTLPALRDAFRALFRRPLAVVLDFWLPTLLLAVALAPSALTAASAADVVRAAMRTPDDPAGLFLAVVLFVSLWIAGLALTGVICAWRAAVWTVGYGEPSR
jgi:hypothetical protein